VETFNASYSFSLWEKVRMMETSATKDIPRTLTPALSQRERG